MESLVLILLAIAIVTWLVLLIPMQQTARIVIAVVAVVLAIIAVAEFLPGALA